MDVFEWLWMWVLDGWVCVGDPLMRWVSVAGWFWWGGRGPPFILNSEVFLLVWKSFEAFLLVSIWAMSSDWSEPDVWILRDDWSELSHASLLVRTWWLNSSWVFLSEPWVLIGQTSISESYVLIGQNLMAEPYVMIGQSWLCKTMDSSYGLKLWLCVPVLCTYKTMYKDYVYITMD